MAARGAFLAPALVPVPSSFVNLPPAFIQSFLGGPDMVRMPSVASVGEETKRSGDSYSRVV